MLAQESIQTKTVFGRLDLARVAFADGADGVAERDAAFQEIDVAEKFQLIRIEEPRIKPICGKRSRREEALVAEIVNGEKGLDADECWVGAEMFAQIDGRERGLPVVQRG